MNRENSTRLPHMQVEYIDEICYPLYKVNGGDVCWKFAKMILRKTMCCIFIRVKFMHFHSALMHHCLHPPQAVSQLFDACSPLRDGCVKNRENWLHFAEDTEEEEHGKNVWKKSKRWKCDV